MSSESALARMVRAVHGFYNANSLYVLNTPALPIMKNVSRSVPTSPRTNNPVSFDHAGIFGYSVFFIDTV